MWPIRFICKWLVGWPIALFIGVIQIIWNTDFAKGLRSIFSIVFRGGILCVIIVHMIFFALPRYAYFEYTGEVTSIRLSNVTISPSAAWFADVNKIQFGNYETANLVIGNPGTTTFIGDNETFFIARPRNLMQPSELVVSVSRNEEITISGRSLVIRPLRIGYDDYSVSVRGRYEGRLFELAVPSEHDLNLYIGKEIPMIPALDFPNYSQIFVDGTRVAGINGNNCLRLTGRFRIYDRRTNELLFTTEGRLYGTFTVTLTNYSFLAYEIHEIRTGIEERTYFRGLGNFYLDSFHAYNENTGEIRFAQSANIRTYEVTNTPVFAIKYETPLAGQFFFNEGIFSVNISGVTRDLSISSYSLFPNINQWLVDNTLIVASTVLSSFIGLLIAQIVKNSRKDIRQENENK